MIPGFQSLMLPVLEVLSDKQERTLRFVIDKISEKYALTQEEKETKLDTGQAIIDNRVGWVRTYLKKAGLIENSKRGILKITAAGLKVLASQPDYVDIKYLQQFEKFRMWQSTYQKNETVKYNARSEKITIKNNSFDVHNDVVLDGAAYLLGDYVYTVTIEPQCHFWRFGMRFSRHEDINFFHPKTRYNDPRFDKYKDLHIGAGQWDNQTWNSPGQIHVAQYNFYEDDNNIIKTIEPEFHEFAITLQFLYDRSKELLNVHLYSRYFDYHVNLDLDKEYEFFKFFAWADGIEYELDLTIQTVSKSNIEQIRTQELKVGKIHFRLGDMFDYPVVRKTNVMLLPLATDGTVSLGIQQQLAHIPIDIPSRGKPGSVQFKSVGFHPEMVEEKYLIGCAFTVDTKLNKSDAKIIDRCLKSLHKDIGKVDAALSHYYNLPLLGTGAGKLSPKEVAFILDRNINCEPSLDEYVVSILDESTFEEIKSFFTGKYTIDSRYTKFESPDEIVALERELNLNMSKPFFKVDYLGRVIALRFTDTRINTLEPLRSFNSLTTLLLIGCNVIDQFMPHIASLRELMLLSTPIYNSQMFLTNGSHLTKLEINSCGFVDVSQLKNMKSLRSLSLRGNQIEDIARLPELPTLIELDFSENLISDITSIAKLSSLVFLGLSKNYIDDIAPLQRLMSLRTVDISHNRIKSIDALRQVNIAHELKANDNPFVSENSLLLKIGDNHLLPIKSVLSRNAEKGLTKITLPVKILLLGNHASGKSSLLQYLLDEKISVDNKSTHLIKIEKYPKDTTDIPEAIFFDFGGQDYYHGIYRAFLSADSINLILWNTSFNQNLQRIDSENMTTIDFSVNYWLCQKSHVDKYYSSGSSNRTESPTLVIQTFSDSSPKSSFGTFAKYNVLNDFYISLHPNNKVRTKADDLALSYLDAIVKQLIDEKKQEREEPLWYKKFIEFIISQNTLGTHESTSLSNIATHYNRKSDNAGEFLKTDLDQLHKNGLILYYQTELPDVAWLNPVALVQYVHDKILKKESISALKGVIDKDEFKLVDPHIMKLLCLQKVLFMHEQSNQYIVPNFLPLAIENSDFDLQTFGLTCIFTLKFVDFLPFGLINQLICFFGVLPDKKQFWRNQLLFTIDQKGKILIHLDFKRLEIKVTGSFSKNVNKNEQSQIVGYLFYGIVGTYWDLELFSFEEFKTIKLEHKESQNADDKNYRKILAFKRIYEDPDYRIKDLYISLNDTEFVRYEELLTTDHPTKINAVKFDDKETIALATYQNKIDFQPFTSIIFPRMKKLFISYSKHDEDFKEEFRKHLITLIDQNLIEPFNCKEIILGADWDATIKREIDECDIMICLVSVDFLNTDYIRRVEIRNAIDKGKILIPIIIKSCDWEASEIGTYFATSRGHTISLRKDLFFKDQFIETSPNERAAFWTSIVKEFREKILVAVK